MALADYFLRSLTEDHQEVRREQPEELVTYAANSGYELEEAGGGASATGGGDGSGDSSQGTCGVVGNWLASGECIERVMPYAPLMLSEETAFFSIGLSACFPQVRPLLLPVSLTENM